MAPPSGRFGLGGDGRPAFVPAGMLRHRPVIQIAVMHSRLQNGDRFSDLSLPTVGGGEIVLPRDVDGPIR